MRFKNTFKFSKNDISKFIFLLRKGIDPYEYMDEREKFNGSNLNMKDIKDLDYTHARKVCKAFKKIKI